MNKLPTLALIVVVIVVFANLMIQPSFADPTPTRGVISVAFDDGFQNLYSYAYPILHSKDIPASFYVITGWINTQNQYGTYMTTSELIDLQNNGNEIGSHSVDHVNFDSLDEATMRYEYSTSKATLESWGINVVGFAYPNGKTRDAWTDQIGLEYYQYIRSGYQEPSVMTLPWTQQPVTAIQGDLGYSYDLDVMKAAVDRVAASGGWTVVVFHDVTDNQGHWLNHIGTDDFAAFLDYVQAKGVTTLTVDQALHINPPRVEITPTLATIEINQSQTFTSSISGGTGPISYQWCLNETAVPGATDSTWTFTPDSTGTFDIYLNLTDYSNYQIQSNVATISVYLQPSVIIAPNSTNLTVGTTQQFTCYVEGGFKPYTYQWYLNDIAVPGATSSTWNFTPETTGDYQVYLNVTDALNFEVQSNAVTDIIVNPQAFVTISSNSNNMITGTSSTFSSTIIGGTEPYSYQWYLNGVVVTGAQSTDWIFTPELKGTYNIYLNVTDSSNITSLSNTETVRVEMPSFVDITPIKVKMYVGQSQTFSSMVSGGFWPYSYQWYLNDTAISGAISQNWIFTPKIPGTYKIFLNVTDNENIIALSSDAIATIEIMPSVTISPIEVKMYVGQSQSFSSSLFGGTLPYVYQWYLNDTIVLGATDANWTFTPTSIGRYRVYLNVTDALNFTVQSNIVTDITVYPPLAVSINPLSVNMVVGNVQTFSSAISGGDQPYTYQWYLDGSRIPNANSNAYTFAATSPGNFTINLIVEDNGTAVSQSNNATLIVKTLTHVAIDPVQVKIYIGQAQTFNSTISGGNSPYIYQWCLNDTAVLGGTSQNWAFTPTSAGHYKIYLNVIDALNLETQSNIVTDVTVDPQLTVSISPTNVNMTIGLQQTFDSTVLGGVQPFMYQWVLNGTAVSGANSSTWSFTPTQTGHYSVYLNVIDSLNSQFQSGIVSDILVYLPLSVSVSPISASMVLGGSQQFNSTVTGGILPYHYQWVLNGTTVFGATNADWNFTPTQTGYYIIYVNITDTLGNQAQSNTATNIPVYSELNLTTANLQSSGIGYNNPDTLLAGGEGRDATATTNVSNSVISSTVIKNPDITDPSSKYSSAPKTIIEHPGPKEKNAADTTILAILSVCIILCLVSIYLFVRKPVRSSGSSSIKQ